MKTPTPLRYSISDDGTYWQCLECDSGNGSDPGEAHSRAAIHIRSAHTSQEITVTPKPQRARHDWLHSIASWFGVTTKPRRAER